MLPRYDRLQTYDWNYQHGPDTPAAEEPPVPGRWEFCGRPVGSRLGIAAGPLLNGRWLLYYAALGFDVLTYKTVRSRARACYPLPNLQPVASGSLHGGESRVPASDQMQGSWAVAFGMPSQSPDVWRADVEWTRRQLPPDKILSVSVVASVEPGWSLDDLAADYAKCARWAIDSGADAVETNFSCPNVSTCDADLYQQPADARAVAERVRAEIGRTPYLIKIGHLSSEEAAAALIDAVAPFADALALTNSIATTVAGPDGTLMFDGQRRGICGDAIREASIAQTRLLSRLIRERGLGLRLVGVGGISRAEHVQEYLAAGAESVHLATAVMVDPEVGLKIRRDLASQESDS